MKYVQRQLAAVTATFFLLFVFFESVLKLVSLIVVPGGVLAHIRNKICTAHRRRAVLINPFILDFGPDTRSKGDEGIDAINITIPFASRQVIVTN